jgi:hypothetical protein
MRIEVLYVAECPFYPVAVKLLRDVLAAENISAAIREVLVTDERMARELMFCGSPTIRVNGHDIAPHSQEAHTSALSCRLYPGSKQIGVPPAEMIHRAVRAGRNGDEP